MKNVIVSVLVLSVVLFGATAVFAGQTIFSGNLTVDGAPAPDGAFYVAAYNAAGDSLTAGPLANGGTFAVSIAVPPVVGIADGDTVVFKVFHADGRGPLLVAGIAGTSTPYFADDFPPANKNDLDITAVSPPEVTGLAPDNVFNGADALITITGSRFTGASLVQLDSGDTLDIEPPVTDDQITAWFRAEDVVPPGEYNVLVTAASGTNETSAVKLLVRGPEPMIVLAPDPLDVGSAKVGETVTGSVVIKNMGDAGADLFVTAVDVVEGAADFAVQSVISADLPDTVAPGGGDSLVVVVAFTPTAGGARAGKLEVTSNDPAQPDTVDLQGVGTVPTISVMPSDQDAPFLWKQGVPPDVDLPVGPGMAVVDVYIEDALDVEWFHVLLTFNDAVLEFVDAVVGPFLAADLVVAPASPSEVNLTGTTLGGAASGEGILARALFRTLGDGLSVMDLPVVHVRQPGGGPFVPVAASGQVQVAPIYFADVEADGVLDVLDIQLVAGRFGLMPVLDPIAALAEVGMLYRADIDGSGKVRINDVQSVAGRWSMPIPGAPRMVPSSAHLAAQILGNGTMVEAGETVWVEIVADDAMALGAFQFDLQFDQDAFEVSKIVLGDLLGSTGNAAAGLESATDDGAIRFGAYSMGSNPGAVGSGVLARVQIVAKTNGEIALSLEDLVATDVLGNLLPVTVLSAVETADGSMLPEQYALAQNYPNPFNPGTTIRYDVPMNEGSDVPVRLEIYDVLGQMVRTLVDAPAAPGSYEVIWSAKDQAGAEVSAGVYFYRMVAGDFTMTRKMILLK